jgi:cellobiose-specific phosphotransferase system component IIC
MDVQDNNMKSQVVGDRINMTTTIELSTTQILDLFHQACNSITKVLTIKQLQRIQANVGVHDSSAILQVLEKISQQNPRGIIIAARIQAHEQKMQFLFANASGMASTVGVGLDFATVDWTRRNEVFVKAIEKDKWL